MSCGSLCISTTLQWQIADGFYTNTNAVFAAHAMKGLKERLTQGDIFT